MTKKKLNTKTVPTSLIEKVKLLLAVNTMSFQNLAEHLGMSLSGLRYGLERRTLNYDQVKLISEFFRVSILDLMDDKVYHPQKLEPPKDIDEIMRLHELAGEELKSERWFNNYLSGKVAELELALDYYRSKYPKDPLSEYLSDPSNRVVKKEGSFGPNFKEFLLEIQKDNK